MELEHIHGILKVTGWPVNPWLYGISLICRRLHILWNIFHQLSLKLKIFSASVSLPKSWTVVLFWINQCKTFSLVDWNALHPLYSNKFKDCWNYFFFRVAVITARRAHWFQRRCGFFTYTEATTISWGVLGILQDFLRQLSGIRRTSDLLGHVYQLLSLSLSGP